MSQTSKPYSSAQTFIRPTQTDQAQGIAQCSAGRLTQISAEPALELLRLRENSAQQGSCERGRCQHQHRHKVAASCSAHCPCTYRLTFLGGFIGEEIIALTL